MFTLKQISLSVSALLVSVCLASCGGDDDEPQYVSPVVSPASSVSDSTDDSEASPCIMPEQMCGNWVLTKAVTTDGYERVINLPFSLLSVELQGVVTPGRSLYNYICAFADNDGIITAKAVTRTEGVLDYIVGFTLVMYHELGDVFIEVCISDDEYHLSGDNLVLSGTYAEVSIADGQTMGVDVQKDASIYLERRD